jgi:hypothetical protein
MSLAGHGMGLSWTRLHMSLSRHVLVWPWSVLPMGWAGHSLVCLSAGHRLVGQLQGWARSGLAMGLVFHGLCWSLAGPAMFSAVSWLG